MKHYYSVTSIVFTSYTFWANARGGKIMAKKRITADMSIDDMVVTMSEGNPGALTCMVNMLNTILWRFLTFCSLILWKFMVQRSICYGMTAVEEIWINSTKLSSISVKERFLKKRFMKTLIVFVQSPSSKKA